MTNTHWYCVKVTLNNGRLLVIPALEIIRLLLRPVQ